MKLPKFLTRKAEAQQPPMVAPEVTPLSVYLQFIEASDEFVESLRPLVVLAEINGYNYSFRHYERMISLIQRMGHGSSFLVGADTNEVPSLISK